MCVFHSLSATMNTGLDLDRVSNSVGPSCLQFRRQTLICKNLHLYLGMF